jgi:hypothetical protein
MGRREEAETDTYGVDGVILRDHSVMWWFEVLRAGVEGPCLHRPENWLVRQLNDEPKLVYNVGFIREKGKATARAVQQSLETSNSLLR